MSTPWWGSGGIQAVGGSLLVANSSAIVADNIPGTGRGRAFGYLAMGWSVGATLGIVLGGIITTLLGWRFIFYINVPIGALALYWGIRYLRDHGRVKARLDLVGMGLLAAALTLVTYGATDIADSGMDAFNLTLTLVGLALIVPFVLWERRSPSPTLNLKLFRSRLLSRSLGATFLQSLGYVSIAFLLIMYLQGVRGLSPLDASLVLVPGYVLSSVFAPFMGRLVDRIGPRLPATVGILLMLAVVLIFTQLTVSTPLDVIA
ncbi:multidrug resistance protein, partial [mine drainage metagenome]